MATDTAQLLTELIELWGNPTQDETGHRLGVKREYVSRILNGLEPSAQLKKSIEVHLQHARQHLKSGDRTPPPLSEGRDRYDQVASRIPNRREPSTRADCQVLFQQILDAAESSGDPNAFPVIFYALGDTPALSRWLNKPRQEE